MRPSVDTSSIRNVTGSANARFRSNKPSEELTMQDHRQLHPLVHVVYYRKAGKWIKPFVCINNSHIVLKKLENLIKVK